MTARTKSAGIEPLFPGRAEKSPFSGSLHEGPRNPEYVLGRVEVIGGNETTPPMLAKNYRGCRILFNPYSGQPLAKYVSGESGSAGTPTKDEMARFKQDAESAALINTKVKDFLEAHPFPAEC